MSLNIPIQRFAFFLSPLEPIVLPPYKGSTFRGSFGHAFKKIVCVSQKTVCADCLLKEKCVYSYVFETPPPSGTAMMRKYEKAPHPFIIEPPLERRQGYGPGDEIKFHLILIGRAIDYLPYFIYTFDALGKMGIGKDRGKFHLRKVTSYKSQVTSEEIVYSGETKFLMPFDHESICIDTETEAGCEASRLTFVFSTPTRIIFQGKLVSSPEFHIIIRSLLRRIALLSYFHCSGNPAKIPFKAMIEKSEEIQVAENRLQWYDWERYSKRQNTKMKLGGFVGSISFKGDLSVFMPFLRAGEMLHLGKGTSFGLGRYKIKEP